MNESFTPEAIVSDFLSGKLNFDLALELLLSILEKSDKSEMRRECIYAFEKIGNKNQKIFKILENSLLSDEDPLVRSAAARLIGERYFRLGKESLLWVAEHEKSPIIIKTIIEITENEHFSQFKSINKSISDWIKNFSNNLGVVPEESRFFLDVESLFAQYEKNYHVSSQTYAYYKFLSLIDKDETWLTINNNHVEILNFNYFNWTFLKKNQDIFNSFLNIRNLDSVLKIYKKFEVSHLENFIIPNSIKYLTSLKKLTLRNNNIRNINCYLTHLKNLEELDLSYNLIQEIPIDLMKLKKLKVLKLNNNNIQEIPHQLDSFLRSLETFEF